MDIERKNAATLKGKPFTLVGPEIKVGQKALISRRLPEICPQ